MRTLAIGDIHGCNTALASLLELVKPGASDRIVFLGDYIDRGPGSRQVVELLIALGHSCSPVFLRGNHEAMILDAREDPLNSNRWQSYGGAELLLSYSARDRADWVKAVPECHWRFLERTKRYFETDKQIFVHACLDPDLDLADQPDWLLFWEYFDRVQPHKSGKRIICGHSQQRSGIPNDLGFATCIDTAPASRGWLTCLDADSGEYWQANERGQSRAAALETFA